MESQIEAIEKEINSDSMPPKSKSDVESHGSIQGSKS